MNAQFRIESLKPIDTFILKHNFIFYTINIIVWITLLISYNNFIVWIMFIIKRRFLIYYYTLTTMKDKSAIQERISIPTMRVPLFFSVFLVRFSRRERSLSKLYDCLEVDDHSRAVPSSQNSSNFEFFLLDTIDAFCRLVSPLCTETCQEKYDKFWRI